MAPHALEDPVPVTTTSTLFQPSSNEQLKPPASVQSSQPERAPLRTIFPYLELEDHPIDEYPSIKVIVVGAGPAGITAGALLTHKVPGLEIVIYERYEDVVSIRPLMAAIIANSVQGWCMECQHLPWSKM